MDSRSDVRMAGKYFFLKFVVSFWRRVIEVGWDRNGVNLKK